MTVELLRTHVSADTLTALSELTEAAKNGLIVGLAVAAVVKGRRGFVSCTGEACRRPLFASALARQLLRELDNLIDQQGEHATTL